MSTPVTYVPTYAKDPDALLDYAIDWAPFLALGITSLDAPDSITESTWDVPDGIDKTDESRAATLTTIWLSGGTVGQIYDITNHVTTAGGRVADDTFRIYIRESSG